MAYIGNRHASGIEWAAPHELEEVSVGEDPLSPSVNIQHSLPNVEELRTMANLGALSLSLHNSTHSADSHSSHQSASPRRKTKRSASLRYTDTSSLLRRSRQKLLLAGMALSFVCLVLGVSLGLTQNSLWSTSRASGGVAVTINYLSMQDIATTASLEDTSSPQYKAAHWLAEYDKANRPVPLEKIDHPNGYKYVVRYVMALLWEAMGGRSWTYQLKFLSQKDICKWNEVVKENGRTYVRGVLCNKEGDPERIILDRNSLVGELPTELGLLTTLNEIDVRVNELQGSLPTELCKLTGMAFFNVAYNYMRGSLPSCLNAWQHSLKELVVSENQLSGSLPRAFLELTKLTGLALDDNSFSGEIAMFDRLVNLEYLFVENNNLAGQLGDTSFAGMTKLEQCDMSNNNIESQTPEATGVPHHLFSLPQLQALDLSRNRLVGLLPPILPKNDKLQYLSLHHNALVGQVPKTIQNLHQLQHLDLSVNNFHGPFHETLGNLRQLRYLFVGGNPRFHAGGIPGNFINLTHLRELSLQNTHRTGPLPTLLGELSNLELIDLNNNLFTGTIPTSWGQLTALKYLLVNRNSQVRGEIPSVFDQWTNLRVAFVDGTGLAGDLDQTLCRLPEFQAVYGPEAAAAAAVATRPDGDHPRVVAHCDHSLTCSVCCTCCAHHDAHCVNQEVNNMEDYWERQYKQAYLSVGNYTFGMQ